MKYIRTKNFVHDSKDVVVVNENGTLVVLRGIDKDFVERTHGKTWNTGTNAVLAQAETVEELCDEFVYTDDTFKNVLYKRLEPIKSLIKLRHNYQVFGAIWVVGENDEPILKSVAKMNSKGELELL